MTHAEKRNDPNRGMLRDILRLHAKTHHAPEPKFEDIPEPEVQDHSDDICPTCGDPDCSRLWGHPVEEQ